MPPGGLGAGARADPDHRRDRRAHRGHPHTLRYYERIGLLSVGRDPAGQRRYTRADFTRLVFLNRLRMTGMPIRDLTRYVELANAGPHTEPERLVMLQEQRAKVLGQVAELRSALDTIEYKITTYGGTCGPA